MNLRIATILLVLVGARITFAQIAVITHKEVPVDSLNQPQILEIYSGEIKFWSNKALVVVFDLKPAGEAKEAFYKFLGKRPSHMKTIWLKKLLIGQSDPPEALPSEEEMVRKVAATPGAIGFVSKAKVTNEVKIIAVIEKNKK